MGVLDIRYRSAQRHELPQLPSYRMENGAADSWRSVAAASRELANAPAAFFNGMMGFARGFAIARERRIDKAVSVHQQGMNAFNSGVSSEQGGGASFDAVISDERYNHGVGFEKGVMNQQVDDEERWLAGNVQFRDEFVQRWKEDLGLSEEDFQEARRRLAGFDLTMQNGWMSKADRAGKARQLGTATSNQASVNSTVASPYLSAEAAPSAWLEWQKCNERLIEANEAKEGRTFSEEERQAVRRANALVVRGAQEDLEVNKLTAEATAAGENGEKVFDERLKALKKADPESFIPESSYLMNPKTGQRHSVFAEALKGADMEKLKAATVAKVEKAKALWHDGMVKSVEDGFVQKQAETVLSIAEPDSGDALSVKEYDRQVVAAYKAIIDKDGKMLARFAPTKLAVAKRAIMGAERDSAKIDREMEKEELRLANEKLRLAKEEERASLETKKKRIKDNSEYLLMTLDDGYIGNHPLTPAEIQSTADELYAGGMITRSAYLQAMKKKAQALTPQAQALHEMIFAQKGAKFPDMCKWQERLGQYVIPSTKAGFKAGNTRLSIVKEEGWIWDDTESLLYKEYVRAANYALEYMQTNNCSVEDAFKEFQSLTLNTERGLAELSYERRLERKRDMLESFKGRTKWRGNSFAGEIIKGSKEDL